MYARLALAVAILAPALAWAAPGPDSTAVLANSAIPESVDLGARYALARQVPDRQVCNLDLPLDVDMTLEDFRSKLLQPLFACLDGGGVTDRIEAVAVMRGVPLRVVIPTEMHGNQSVSLAAALQTWKSTLTSGGAPFLGSDPGTLYGNGLYGGTWSTPYAGSTRSPFAGQAFGPGWSRSSQGVDWKPALVTMLHGRSYEEAGKLLDSALTAEMNGGAKGDFVLMDGGDPARGSLDYQYTLIQPELEARGITVSHVPFNSDLSGLSIAALAVGTAGFGQTIEGNTYLPGSIVDNLTSYGAVPQNFEATGESQVSIARWVAMGVAGVHGTTEEPISNAFPTRTFLLHYVDGFTLAESYEMEIPFFYWRNLVLGDPMAAPYAVRPQVVVTVGDCLQVDGTRHVKVATFDTERIGVGSVALYLDGASAGTGGTGIEADLTLPRKTVQLLAVAQKRDDGSLRGKARPKGWAEARVDGTAAVEACAMGGSGGEGGTGGTGGEGGAAAGSGGGGQGGLTTHHDAGKSPHNGGCSTAGGASLLALLLAAVAVRRR